MTLIVPKKKIGLIHKVYTALNKKRVARTACTKTRAEVRGGGKKPWKQKGTGHARAGSIRSSIWVGGGVIFGPKPSKSRATIKINCKERALAIKEALMLKKKSIVLVNSDFFCLDKIKTSDFYQKLKNLGLNQYNNSILLITDEKNKNLDRASKNLPKIYNCEFNKLCLSAIIKAAIIILSKEANKRLYETNK